MFNCAIEDKGKRKSGERHGDRGREVDGKGRSEEKKIMSDAE